VRARGRTRYASDPNLRLRVNLCRGINQALRSQSLRKNTRTESLLGCTVAALRAHLEALFEDGMTWANYGAGWHVDHIIPCAAFDLTDEEQQRKCFHWSNLRPLCGAENIAKSDKLPDGTRGREVRGRRR